MGSGAIALKGADAHLTKVLSQVAREEGVALGLAELECHMVGGADEDFGYDESPFMGEVERRTTTVSSLVDLNGKKLIGRGKIEVSEKELIPGDPFVDEDPDDRDYEGYMGNVGLALVLPFPLYADAFDRVSWGCPI